MLACSGEECSGASFPHRLSKRTTPYDQRAGANAILPNLTFSGGGRTRYATRGRDGYQTIGEPDRTFQFFRTFTAWGDLSHIHGKHTIRAGGEGRGQFKTGGPGSWFPSGDPILREEVSYTLAWKWGSAKPHPTGGWTLTNDLGYEVHVTEGLLITRNLELLPCHRMPPQTPAALWRLLAPPTAYAGHGSLLPNQSKIQRSYQEDLATPGDLKTEIRIVTDPEYCQGHYLVARAKGVGPGGKTLVVAGTWRKYGSAEAVPFRIESSFAYGEIKDLLLAGRASPMQRLIVGGIHVRVERSLESLFRKIDFASSSEQERGIQILRSLVGGARLLVDDS